MLLEQCVASALRNPELGPESNRYGKYAELLAKVRIEVNNTYGSLL